MKLRNIILTASVLMLSWTVKAQESVPATEVFQFLSFPRSIASVGMAGAGSIGCVFENPAALPVNLDKAEFMAMYSHTVSNNFGGGAALRLGKGFALSATVFDQAHAVKDFGTGYAPFAPNDLIMGFGAGAGFGEHFSVGVSAKVVKQHLMADYSLSSTAFTVMLLYRLSGLSIAAGIANFGSGVKSETEQVSPLPTSAHGAATYEFNIGSSSIAAAIDADYYFSGKFGISAGAQYSFRKMIYARAGYRYATAGAAFPSHLAFGLGYRWKSLCLDISYLTANAQLANSIGAGVSLRF